MSRPSHPGEPEGPPHPSPGDVLAGKYRVEQVLGAGGMGVVVAAMHLVLEERVALKFLHAGMVKPETMARFSREARAAAKIKSDHVARVTDVGSLESGAPYMVMEYLEGQDLGALLATSGKLPVRDAVEFIVQTCDAVAEAHTLGIIHRDLKPTNLFIARRSGSPPLVKVLDFGISKVTQRGVSLPPEEAMGMTRTRAWLGSPLYMSPEQMRSARDVDARGDIWALGVILFEMLAGSTPFDAETFPELCAQIMHGEPRSLAAARPDAPPGLVAVVNRCLEKDAERRYQTVAELVMALVEYAPRRARSVAERAVAITEAAGMLAQRPREALDGTLPEMRMSPLHGLPPPEAPPAPHPAEATRGEPQAAHAGNHPRQLEPYPASLPPPASPLGARPESDTLDLSITRRRDDPHGATATWIGVALGMVVVIIFGIGLYLRKHYALPGTQPAPESTATAPARH